MKVNRRQVRLVISEAERLEVKLKFIEEFDRFSRTSKSLQEYLDLIKSNLVEIDFPTSSFAILKRLVLKNEGNLFIEN